MRWTCALPSSWFLNDFFILLFFLSHFQRRISFRAWALKTKNQLFKFCANCLLVYRIVFFFLLPNIYLTFSIRSFLSYFSVDYETSLRDPLWYALHLCLILLRVFSLTKYLNHPWNVQNDSPSKLRQLQWTMQFCNITDFIANK